MLKIIDRYILWQFLKTFAICFVSLAGLYIVVDALTHLDSFLEHGRENGGALNVLAGFYAFRVLDFFDRTAGILTLLAAMFTITWLQRHQEMTALLAAGVHKARVIAPVLIAAVAMACTAAANRDLVLPYFRSDLLRSSKDLAGDKPRDLQPTIDRQTDILLGGAQTNLKERSILAPQFGLPVGLDAFGPQLTAEEAAWLPASAQHPAGYLFRRVQEPNALLTASAQVQDGQVVIFTPPSAAWLAEGELFVVSNVPFAQLDAGQSWQSYASTWELIRHANNPAVSSLEATEVAIHSRMVQPLLDLLLLAVGLPFVLSKASRNPFLTIGLSMLVIAVFLLVVVGTQFLGASGWIAAPLAAWLPVVTFAPVAAGLTRAFSS